MNTKNEEQLHFQSIETEVPKIPNTLPREKEVAAVENPASHLLNDNQVFYFLNIIL